MGYSLKTAIKVTKIIEKFDVFWFEEPLRSRSVDDYSALASAIDIPIALGENLYTIYDFREFLSRGCVDIVQPDCNKVGGISESRKIASMASAWHIKFAPHVFGSAIATAANLHVVCSASNSFIFEYDMSPYDPLRDELVKEPIKVKNGYIEVPKKPGLGIEINEEFIKKYPYIGGPCYVK